MNLWDWITPFQLVLLIELGVVVWAVLSKEAKREWLIGLACFGVIACIYFYHGVGPATQLENGLGFCAFLGGWFFCHNASIYHEREMKALEHAIERKDRERELLVVDGYLEEQQIRRDFVERRIQLEELQLDKELQKLLHEIEAGRMAAEEGKLRWGIIAESARTNLHPSDIYNLNKMRAEGQAKIEEKAAEAKAVIEAAQTLNLAKVNEVLELRKKMKEAIIEKQRLVDSKGEKADAIKDFLIMCQDGDIEFLKGEIREREGNRLVPPSDGQEALGDREEDSDLGGHTESNGGEAEVKVPPQKRRGRPPGSPNKGGGKGKSSSHSGDNGRGKEQVN